MTPYTTLVKGMRVGMCRKVSCVNSNLSEKSMGKVFIVTGWDTAGRKHNRYISMVFLEDTKRNRFQASIEELGVLNPNFEPESEFITCVGCGATVTEDKLRIKNNLRGIKACPSCGMLEPHES